MGVRMLCDENHKMIKKKVKEAKTQKNITGW